MKSKVLQAWIPMVVAATLPCCANEPASGGADGGVGGQVDTRAADVGGNPAEVPRCLQALFASCSVDGLCRSPPTAAGQSREYCFANGVRAAFTRTGGCDGTGTVLLEVRKADGALCYTNEVRQGVICEGESFTWKDASGNLVASGESGQRIQCVSGESGNCTDGQCQLGSVWSGKTCDPGSCP